MITHPTAAELSEAVALFEAEPVTPGDARHAFLARVTDNARATLAREAEHGARLEADAVERLSALLGKTGDYATAAAAVLLRMTGDSVQDVSIGLTNVGPTALKAKAAEDSLRGKKLDEAAIGEAARLAMSICEPAEDQRGDIEYKTAMAGEMTRRALSAAASRASR